MKIHKCGVKGCDEDAIGSYAEMPVCELCMEGFIEGEAERNGPDPHGDLDPTPEEQAGWAFDDKLEMYRNEY